MELYLDRLDKEDSKHLPARSRFGEGRRNPKPEIHPPEVYPPAAAPEAARADKNSKFKYPMTETKGPVERPLFGAFEIVRACPGATFRMHTVANRSADCRSYQVASTRQVWARDFEIPISDLRMECSFEATSLQENGSSPE
jgi:hypothetical protein